MIRDVYFLPIPDPGSKRHRIQDLEPQHWQFLCLLIKLLQAEAEFRKKVAEQTHCARTDIGPVYKSWYST